MARTTTEAVIALLTTGRDYDTENNPDVGQFIDTASVIVDRVRTCSSNRGKGLLDSELELVERWLAAHCYACSDQPYASKSTAGASGSFQGRTGLALEGTKYGQMALTVDYSGCLSAISKRQTAGGFWLGNSPESTTPGSVVG